MNSNSIGKAIVLTTFGESHGDAIGGVLDGMPAGVKINIEDITLAMARRRPGMSSASSARKEKDEVEILSGIHNNVTTGTPIAFIIKNEDKRSSDYQELKDIYRPSHADYTYQAKYGVRDYRGGGRASARETAVRVAAGAIVKQILDLNNITITAYTSRIGNISLPEGHEQLELKDVYNNEMRCPDISVADKMKSLLEDIKKSGDSIGGVVSCVIKGIPVGLGEPVFDKLQADLAKAMLSINAAKGFEYGSGFSSATMRGSEHNDAFTIKDGHIRTVTNFSGGIQGGISNGEDIYFNVAFKPTPSISQSQQTINTSGEAVSIEIKGRHDSCVVLRAVAVVEAMAILVVGDHLLRAKNAR